MTKPVWSHVLALCAWTLGKVIFLLKSFIVAQEILFTFSLLLVIGFFSLIMELPIRSNGLVVKKFKLCHLSSQSIHSVFMLGYIVSNINYSST